MFLLSQLYQRVVFAASADYEEAAFDEVANGYSTAGIADLFAVEVHAALFDGAAHIAAGLVQPYASHKFELGHGCT